MRRDLATLKAAEIAEMRDLIAQTEGSARMVGGWAIESQAQAVAFQEERLRMAQWLVVATESEVRGRRDALRAMLPPDVLARRQGDVRDVPFERVRMLALIELMDMVLGEL